MPIYSLFNDKTFSHIKFDFLTVGERENVDRIQIKCFFSDDAVINSAEKGIWSVYNRLAGRHLVHSGKKYYIVCEFDSDDVNKKVTGSSAGLAFALQFVQEILRIEKNYTIGYSIAVTGAVSDRTGRAKVQKVDSITEKIETAIQILKAGDKIIFPEANQIEVEESLRRKIIKKKIILCPVQTVDQALDIILESYRSLEPKKEIKRTNFFIIFKSRTIQIASVAVVIIIITMFFIFNKSSPEDYYNKIIKNLESGEFESANKIYKDFLLSFADDTTSIRWQSLKNYFVDELNLDIVFEYFKEDSQLITTNKSISDILLGTDDGYRFKITASYDCYLYILQIDSNNGVELLFPLSSFALKNHYLKKNIQYFIPGGDNYFYLSDYNHHGNILVYIIASSWRSLDIEKSFTDYEQSSSLNKLEKFESLVKHIEERKASTDAEIKGIYYSEEKLLQE